MGRTFMRAWLSILLASLLLAGLAGCKGKADTMSEHLYFLRTLDRRWETIRKSFQSDKPNISFCSVLLRDLSGAVGAMKRTYTKPNRDEAIAKLEALTKTFQAELETKVDMRHSTIRLRPGATFAEVGEVMERGYQEYIEFKKLLGEG